MALAAAGMAADCGGGASILRGRLRPRPLSAAAAAIAAAGSVGWLAVLTRGLNKKNVGQITSLF